MTETTTTETKTDFRTVAEMALNDPYTALQGAMIAEHPITGDWDYFVAGTPAHDIVNGNVVKWDTIDDDYQVVFVSQESAQEIQDEVDEDGNRIDINAEIDYLELGIVDYDDTTRKIEALAKHLEIATGDISAAGYDECEFENLNNGTYYFVCTDEEADDRAAEYIRESLWAFRSYHLVDHMSADIDIEDIEKLQEMCESANPIIASMLDDVDDFINDMICLDGRGPFLNKYDDEEYKIGDYYLYLL